MNGNKKHPDFTYMVVSIVAFICTAVVAVVQSRSTGELQKAMIVFAPIVFAASLLVPVIVRADAYSSVFRSQARTGNFSATYAINQYKLHGWIKYKYKFLEAISEACNGNFEHAFELYTFCLEKSDNKILRAACYKDMVKNLNRMNNTVRLLPYIIRGCEEFPDERDLFEWVAGYYMWYRYADEAEALEWFGKAAVQSTDDRIKARAHFYTGLSLLYNKQYEKAETELAEAYDLFGDPPCYLCVDIAVCKACLGKNDEAREYAVQSIVIADDKTDIDYISEKLSYMFRAKSEDVNPEMEKLIEELIRRRTNDLENAVRISDIEKYNSTVEKMKKIYK